MKWRSAIEILCDHRLISKLKEIFFIRQLSPLTLALSTCKDKGIIKDKLDLLICQRVLSESIVDLFTLEDDSRITIYTQ